MFNDIDILLVIIGVIVVISLIEANWVYPKGK